MIEPAARQRILGRLAELEAECGVRILYAAESGSRAWGFPSTDSDYDVRFVYAHPRDWYLCVDSEARRDVIERPIVADLDVAGWDVRKALGLYLKSNPPLLEWLGSPHVYLDRDGFADQLRGLLRQHFQPASGRGHYLHMARGNYRQYLRGETVWRKKYFYVLRPLLACRWIDHHGTPAPMELRPLLELVADRRDLCDTVDALLAEKLAGGELDEGPRSPALHEFLDAELQRLETLPAAPPMPVADRMALNELFRAMIGA